jgi:exonuclease III
MTIEVDTITMPAFWATALINDDRTGMSDAEEAAMDAFMQDIEADGWYVVDVVRNDDGEADEARFTWSYRLHGGDANGGDVIDYVIHRQKE